MPGFIINRQPDLSAYQALVEKGAASGYAPLDAGSRVPATNAPAKAVYTTGGAQAITPADIGASSSSDVPTHNASTTAHGRVGNILPFGQMPVGATTTTVARGDAPLTAQNNAIAAAAADATTKANLAQAAAIVTSEAYSDAALGVHAAISDASTHGGALTNSRTPILHDLTGVLHASTTLAGLNAKITDAVLDDSSATRNPNAHAIDGAAHTGAGNIVTHNVAEFDAAGAATTAEGNANAYTDAQVAIVVGPTAPGVVDIAALRAVAAVDRVADQKRLVASNGSVYSFNTTSTAVDDGNFVVKPTDVAPGDPGRWLKTTQGATDHEGLANLLGGAAGDHRHITTAQNAALHTQGTDQGLDTGGPNAVTVAQVKAAVTATSSALQPLAISVTTTPYAVPTVPANAYLVLFCDAGSAVINIPTVAAYGAGRPMVIARRASVGNITINPSGVETIAGDTSQTLILDHESLTLVGQGTSWEAQ